jgi:hypothetical protein
MEILERAAGVVFLVFFNSVMPGAFLARRSSRFAEATRGAILLATSKAESYE